MNSQPVVLYIEDDPQSRTLMQMLLQGRMKLPHVTILENSEDFLEQMAALDPRPDIIFLDIHMKPIDGFEMLELLRGLDWTAGRPIVALTASVMNEEVARLRSAGFNGCLAKPIDLVTFPETLGRIMDGETIWRIIA
ncbi:MAG TPA: response regulator [Phototrophicaceae bacterium]|jgi:CheY-like chemotaxis protein|nr:response regulator [Phototrophicaceae bacterium]